MNTILLIFVLSQPIGWIRYPDEYSCQQKMRDYGVMDKHRIGGKESTISDRTAKCVNEFNPILSTVREIK
jgi:hypothetical protein